MIGRKREQQLLEKAYVSKEAEFIVVYGRRRVGKTYLVTEFFNKKKCIIFQATGLQNGTLDKQLKKFSKSISETFFDNAPLKTFKNWEEAFGLLHQQILKTKTKTLIFMDELPWMATPKSGLLEEIDYYWNKYWSKIPYVIFIVCGSSASWLIKKIIYNKGGLHNRITAQIKLLPFNLSDTNAYLKSRKTKLNHKHVLSLYMALGGVPYYLRYVEAGMSAEQNIQKIFFDDNAPLMDEFSKLFNSLFKNADSYVELITLISKKKEGLSRSELNSTAILSTGGGRLSKRLKDLCDTGFIEEYIPWDRTRGEFYKLIDEFCIFYLQWIHQEKNKKFSKDHWLNQSQRPSYYAWSGYAFEAICKKHIHQIIHTLGIKATTIGTWRFIPRKIPEDGAQIDLVIDRSDNAITLCEIKYTDKIFSIDKQYVKNLQKKITVFKAKTKTQKQIFMTLISANGIKSTTYSKEIIDNVVTQEDLFSN